jgi:glycine/D-amino acid oxidase-like deaminating enzyme
MLEWNNLSYWESKIWKKKFDLIVVGSGITGATAAIHFAKRNLGKRILVVDQFQFGLGATSKNAGFICFGSPSELLETKKNFGVDFLESQLRKKWHGHQILLKTFGASAIQAKMQGGAEVFQNKEDAETALEELPMLNQLFKKVSKVSEQFASSACSFPRFHESSISIQIEGNLDSGSLLSQIRKKFSAYNIPFLGGLKVENFERKSDGILLQGRNFEFFSEKVLFATNAFASEKPTVQPILPGRGLVKVSSPLSYPFPNGTFHLDRGYTYFRKVDGNRLLIGGYRNLDKKSEETLEVGTNEVISSAIDQVTKENILGFLPEWDYSWNGWMGFTADENPIIQKLDDGIVVTAGMNGMGVTLGPFAALEALRLFR